MIISKQKPLEEILEAVKKYNKIFLIGCGECATTCKSGGKDELIKLEAELEKSGKIISGFCIPDAPCAAAKLKSELAKNIKTLKESDAVLVLACGLGVQSVKDNDRFSLNIISGCDTICAAVMDAKGNFYEKCSACGDCVLNITGGICPVTLCPKGILNGPCGGMDKGKCEVDKERDCAWILIYKELEKKNDTLSLKKIRPPRDFKKSGRPHKIIMSE